MNKNLSVILLVLFFQSVFSQEYTFERYNVQEGLSQSVVKCSFQDNEGYLWFGTQDGINRFDGYDFLKSKRIIGDSASLSDNWIYDLFQANDENIWIGTHKGLNVYNKHKNTFKSYVNVQGDLNSIYNNNVVGITADKSGNIIANTPPYINIFDKNNNNFKRINTGIEPDHGISDENVPIIADKEGLIWIASTRGLSVYNPKNEDIKNYRYVDGKNKTISHNNITALYEDNKGNIWIGTQNGLDIFNKKKNTFSHFYNNTDSLNTISNNYIRSILQDENGDMWIGTNGGGLNKLVKGKKSTQFTNFQNNQRSNSLSNNIVLSLYQDRSGVLWVGTINGLNKVDLKKKKFKLYKNSNSVNTINLSSNTIASIYKQNDRKIWIGTWGTGLNIYNRETGNVELYSTTQVGKKHLTNDFIHVIFKDKKENMWIGSRNGIDIHNSENKSFVGIREFFDLHSIPSFRNFRINHIFTDYKGIIWIASHNGLHKLDIENDTYKHFTKENSGICDNLIYEIFEDHKNNIWITTANGLDVFNQTDETFKHYTHDPKGGNSICDNFTVTVCEDKSGKFWIGTQSGICRLNTKYDKFRYYSENDGISDAVVYEIISDKNDNIWIATGRGLYMFDYKENKIKPFDLDDGLQSMEFNTACHISDDGEMFFGGMEGLNYFYPDSITNINYIPPIVITSIERTNNSGKEIIYQDSLNIINLSHEDFEFTIKFSSLDFTNTSKNKYAYKMVGVSNKWNEIGNQRFKSFSGLPSGTYTFYVKGTNTDGIWNEEGIAITIIINPPWWKTKYAKAFYLIILIVGITLVIKLRERKLLKEKTLLERKVKERTEEIRHQKELIEESHQEITDSINYASRIQAAMLPLDSDVREYFNEHFIIYKPKEIVSGDFYWIKNINDYLVIAAADCTGHGVPGAFVSMLGISYLNEIVRRKDISQASQVLDALRHQVKESLHQTDKASETKDGMDIALCVINRNTNELQYSGAYNPVYIIIEDRDEKALKERLRQFENNEKIRIQSFIPDINGIDETANKKKPKALIEFKADRQPIAIHSLEKPFTNFKIQLQKGDKLYMFSDGFADQFNGITGEKFKVKRFKGLLLRISEKSIKEQEKDFEKTFMKWKGDSEQVDDLLLLGFEL